MAGGTTIRGLIINRFPGRGIVIWSGSNSSVLGCYIGTDVSGTLALGNSLDGIHVGSDASCNALGGLTPSHRNVISGNGDDGIGISGSRTLVTGNYIGTDVSGTLPLGNGFNGVVTGVLNGYNTIGGTTAGAENIVAANGGAGVCISSGSANGILTNSIHDNGALGIELFPDGVTPNDWHDLDIGANTLQNHPELLSAYSSEWGSSIRGKLHSTPSSTFRIELFSNNATDPIPATAADL